jgi:hypothetical protein
VRGGVLHPLLVHQRRLLLLLIVCQASHDLTSFSATLLIINIQAAPHA